MFGMVVRSVVSIWNLEVYNENRIKVMAILDQLIENFSTDTLNYFFKQVIPTFKTDDWNYDFLFEHNENIQESYSNIEKLGEADLSNGDDILVISAKTSTTLTDRTGKKQQYEIAKKILKEEIKDAAFFIFYDTNGQFRFSFIKADFKGTKREFTAFKRYTYFITPEQTNQTFIGQISSCDFSDLDEIQNAFSVEPLNKQFYQKIAKAFYSLIGGKVAEGSNAKEYLASLKLPSLDPVKNHRVYQEFAVRFIGRTIFIWFLKNKESDAGLPLIPDEWLTSGRVTSTKDYYHSLLEKLFFEILNTPIEERIKSLPDEHNTIPFLNGGLFEPQHDDFYEIGFNDFSKHHNTLCIPDKWISDLFETLEQFNFTIDENTLTDMEVSIDPEMLGTIFENLLAEIDPDTKKSARKSTGSFYTPREIVDYMVVESLVAYLHTKTVIDEDLLRSLFVDSELRSELQEYKSDLIDAFDEVKILDPACGSGAFPMGALHKINLALQQLDPAAKVWKEKQLYKIDNVAYRNALKDKLDKSNVDYIRKIGIIQHSIYGVDIQPIATEISKLRSFLSLVVDENIDDAEPNRGIYPLPNLEFKFVTANTLIGLKKHSIKTSSQAGEGFDFGGIGKDIDQLQQTRDQYLQSYGEKKEELKKEFLRIQQQIAYKEFSPKSSGQNKTAQQIISWNPFSHEKSEWFETKWMFGIDVVDIVIGNPPYIQLQKQIPDNNTLKLADLYSGEQYETFTRTGDIYALFFERGTEILSENGFLCYITSNKWMRAGYGQYLRGYFVKKTSPRFLIDFSAFQVFESASVDSSILGLKPKLIKYSGKFMACTIGAKFTIKNSISEYFANHSIPMTNITDSSWTVRSKNEQELINKIEEVGKPLTDWPITINYGIKTGLNAAFIIDTKTRDSIVRSFPESVNIIKPIIRGREVRRYGFMSSGLWLINTHNGYLTESGVKVPRVMIEKFPGIKKHLDKYKAQLTKRSDKGATPYNLRNCAYMEDFQNAKLIYAETMRVHKSGERFPRFGLATEDQLTDKTCFIMKGPDIKYILGVLNSKMGNYLIYQYVTKLDSGGFNMQKIHIEPIPIPMRMGLVRTRIETLVDDILNKVSQAEDFLAEENEVDLLVYKQYQLSFKEVQIIEPGIRISHDSYENLVHNLG